VLIGNEHIIINMQALQGYYRKPRTKPTWQFLAIFSKKTTDRNIDLQFTNSIKFNDLLVSFQRYSTFILLPVQCYA